MTDNNAFGFGRFVPGFDFLQSLAKGATQTIPQMPNLANWVAPTLNVEELDKRIQDLKSVHYWLDQNAKALAATIQALEVQRMTLATLQGMNFNMGDLANALKLKAADAVVGGVQKAAETAASAAGTVAGAAAQSGAGVRKAARPAARKPRAPAAEQPVVDPMQWWGSLTQQFQQIAANAMKDASQKTAVDATRNMATGLAKETLKAAAGAAKAATAGLSAAAAAPGSAASGAARSGRPKAAPARKPAAAAAPGGGRPR